MNRISYRETKNVNKHKISLKAKAKEDKLKKELQINGFNIIELNEEEIKEGYQPIVNLFSEREKQRLEKKAKSIEEYYYSIKTEDEKINENCFNCLMNNFKPNELLYFSKRKDLIDYLKYCFYFLKNILFLDNQIYIENRYDLDKCYANYLNGWRFFIPKTVCRACFLQIINMEHLFGNLKTIFSDIDSHIPSKSLSRNRPHFNSRARNSGSMNRYNISKKSNINENDVNGKDKIISSEKVNNKVKNKIIRYGKNSNIISYDNKKGLISIKKDILGDVLNLINEKEGNERKLKNNSKVNTESNHVGHNVKEIKIKTSDYAGERNISEKDDKKEKGNKVNKNKDSFIIKNENKINKKNNKNINNLSKDNSNNNSINENSIDNSKKNNNDIESTQDKSNNNIIKNKKNMDIIYNEILNIKNMNNGIVIKLHIKLTVFKDILLYTIINIGDFKEKLINSMHFKPEIISYGINQYETYFSSLYNEGFKAKKEYEEIFTKIKDESIPSISKNISKLKEEKLNEDEKIILGELENYLNEYSKKIDEMVKSYDENMNNFFTNFLCFFSLIKELKQAFRAQFY